MDKYEKLKKVLIKAIENAKQAEIEDDGGTCNFDSPVLPLIISGKTNSLN